MKNELLAAQVILSIFISFMASANNISSDWVKVTSIRSMIDGNVFFVVDDTAMCNTNTFLLRVNNDSVDVAYSALLTAAAAGKEVKLETWGACAENGGWGTEIQAVNVRFP